MSAGPDLPPWRERGWTKAPNRVLYHPRLSRGAKLLYEALTHRQGQNDDSWPSQATLAADLGYKSRYTINLLTKQLIAAGLLEVTRSDRRGSNHYRVLMSNELDSGRPINATSDVKPIRQKEDRIEEEPEKKRSSKGQRPHLSMAIAGVASDIGRELGDLDHEASNITQALNLWTDSDLPEAAFIALMREVKQRVRHAQAHGVGNKMAYFFATLRRAI